MTTRYYEETPCPECGRYHQESLLRKGADPESSIAYCYVGGQRRELTGVEVVEVKRGDADASLDEPLLVTSHHGRYLIILLEEPADG